MFKSILAILFISLFSSQSFAKECTFTFVEDKAVVEGTGFKFTEKKGVTARFEKFSLNDNKPAKSIQKLLEGKVVSVDLMSNNSGDALRDRNLQETLFADVMGDAQATVTVNSVSANTIKATLQLNEKSKVIVFKYKVNGDKVEAQSNFDLMDFAMGGQFEALKKRCNDLHVGSDGKSVTWSAFDLKVTAPFKKACK